MSVRKMLSLVSQGITQHIGAYGVTLDNGHSFRYTRTRGLYCYARGAQVTDIAIIVIADDDIMPQTKEAISRSSSRCRLYLLSR
jgi:translation initiation factor IF-2